MKVFKSEQTLDQGSILSAFLKTGLSDFRICLPITVNPLLVISKQKKWGSRKWYWSSAILLVALTVYKL